MGGNREGLQREEEEGNILLCKFHDHDKEKVKEEDIGDVDVRDDSAILIILEWRHNLEFSYVKKKTKQDVCFSYKPNILCSGNLSTFFLFTHTWQLQRP